jgi:hypothetical protein
VAVFLLVFTAIRFFVPALGGKFLEVENFEPANVASTPEHIAPYGISLRTMQSCARSPTSAWARC